jgi:hypothetical protein
MVFFYSPVIQYTNIVYAFEDLTKEKGCDKMILSEINHTLLKCDCNRPDQFAWDPHKGYCSDGYSEVWLATVSDCEMA